MSRPHCFANYRPKVQACDRCGIASVCASRTSVEGFGLLYRPRYTIEAAAAEPGTPIDALSKTYALAEKAGLVLRRLTSRPLGLAGEARWLCWAGAAAETACDRRVALLEAFGAYPLLRVPTLLPVALERLPAAARADIRWWRRPAKLTGAHAYAAARRAARDRVIGSRVICASPEHAVELLVQVAREMGHHD